MILWSWNIPCAAAHENKCEQNKHWEHGRRDKVGSIVVVVTTTRKKWRRRVPAVYAESQIVRSGKSGILSIVAAAFVVFLFEDILESSQSGMHHSPSEKSFLLRCRCCFGRKDVQFWVNSNCWISGLPVSFRFIALLFMQLQGL